MNALTQPTIQCYVQKAPTPLDLVPDMLNPDGTVIAILDAARLVNLPELIATQGLRASCLFQGDLAEEAQDVAPWLVSLKPDDRLFQALFTIGQDGKPGPFAHWTAQPGIFIKTDMDLPALRQHLRRFLRVDDGRGKMFLFRYWEPRIAGAYFAGLVDRPSLIARWFATRDGGRIHALMVPQLEGQGAAMTVLRPVDLSDQPAPPSGVFALNDNDMLLFEDLRLEQDVALIADKLRATFPDVTAPQSDAALHDLIRQMTTKMKRQGFRQKHILFTMMAWELHYGPNFETRDPDNEIRRILRRAGPEADRFEMLKTRVKALS